MAVGTGMFDAVMKRLHRPVYASRLRELVRQITPHLRSGDRVLDVGCGFGALGKALLDARSCPPGVHVKGLERVRRGNELIEVRAYEGVSISHEDRSHDVVILADVLHHESDPDPLLRECVRVSRRLVIMKDHQVKGFLAQQRISLLDWAANAPYGVTCTHQYKTPGAWTELRQRHGLVPIQEFRSMRLYPRGLDLLFGGSLQYMAILRVP